MQGLCWDLQLYLEIHAVEGVMGTCPHQDWRPHQVGGTRHRLKGQAAKRTGQEHLMECSKDRCRALTMGRKTPWQQQTGHSLAGDCSRENGLGIRVWSMSQQTGVTASWTATRQNTGLWRQGPAIWYILQGVLASKRKQPHEGFLSKHISAFVHKHLKYLMINFQN